MFMAAVLMESACNAGILKPAGKPCFSDLSDIT